MQNSGSPIADIPAFSFRISAEDVGSYRRALGGGSGDRVPFGMALRALATQAALLALKAAAAGRHPVHVAQDYRAERPLCAGVDYLCEVRLQRNGEDRLRIEQRLCDPPGTTCLLVASDIVLVSP